MMAHTLDGLRGFGTQPGCRIVSLVALCFNLSTVTAVRLCYLDRVLSTAIVTIHLLQRLRAMATRKNECYRVYRLPETSRRSLKATGSSTTSRIRPCWMSAVTKELPKIVATLKKLGIRPLQKTRPARLQVDADLLGALRVGSAQTGVPASRLVAACLGLFCHNETKGRK